MKSKTQRLGEAWVPIEKRLPTGGHEQIVYWVPEYNAAFVDKAMNLYQAAVSMLDPARKPYVAWDKRLSHWMKLVPPINQPAVEEK